MAKGERSEAQALKPTAMAIVRIRRIKRRPLQQLQYIASARSLQPQITVTTTLRNCFGWEIHASDRHGFFALPIVA
jgi:hypothetical protein